MMRLALLAVATVALMTTPSLAAEKYCNTFSNVTNCEEHIGSFDFISVSDLNHEGPGITVLVNGDLNSFSLTCTKVNPKIRLRINSLRLKGDTDDQFTIAITINETPAFKAPGTRLHTPDEYCEMSKPCLTVYYYWAAEIKKPDDFIDKFENAKEIAFSIPRKSGPSLVLKYELKDADVVVKRLKDECGKAPQ